MGVTEYEQMIENPKGLFDAYLEAMGMGIALNDGQRVKFEYLKKLFVKE